METYLQRFLKFDVIEQKDKFLILKKPDSLGELLSCILLHLFLSEEKENFGPVPPRMDSGSR